MALPSDSEALRRRYMPTEVRVLFVGESEPAGGTFFYNANSRLYAATKAGFEQALPALATQSSFLESFKGLGCWLVDLCDRPVNRLPKQDRLAARDAGVAALSAVIGRVQPAFVAVVMMALDQWVDRALEDAAYAVEAALLAFPSRPEWRQRYERDLAGLVAQWSRDGLLSPAWKVE
jgi:hypothetical protein